MYLQIWSCSSYSQTSFIPIWFWFAVEIWIWICFGMSNSIRWIFTYLETASVEILNILTAGSFFNLSSSFPMELFLQSCDLRVFQWIHPRKVWGSLVICGLFPGRFLNDFGLSCLDLTCLKENLSIFGLESFLRKQRVDFHSTSFVVPVLI